MYHIWKLYYKSTTPLCWVAHVLYLIFLTPPQHTYVLNTPHACLFLSIPVFMSTAHTHTLKHTTYSTNLNFLPLYIHGPYTEIHSDGVLLFLWENPWLEIVNHTGLPYVRVSNQDDLKQKIERVIMFRPWGLHGGDTVECVPFICGCLTCESGRSNLPYYYRSPWNVWTPRDGGLFLCLNEGWVIGNKTDLKMLLGWDVPSKKRKNTKIFFLTPQFFLPVKATVGHQVRFPAAG